MNRRHPYSEFDFIGMVREKFSGIPSSGMEGIGDDCAVLPTGGGRSMLLSTDMLVEEVHFLPETISAYDLGYKSLAVNLSDIAAMGASPTASFLSVGFPAGLSDRWKEEFTDGYRELSEKYGIPLLGGDTTRAGKLTISVTVTGEASDDRIKRRSGARPGDTVIVTGPLGNSAGGLKLLLSGSNAGPDEKKLITAHQRPEPHLQQGEFLAGLPYVHSMMDVSDGVASDLLHILRASGAGAVIDIDRLPISGELQTVSARYGWDAAELAATGGEDYVLLFTVEPGMARELESLYRERFGRDPFPIGTITEGDPEIEWRKCGRKTHKDWKGFKHF